MRPIFLFVVLFISVQTFAQRYKKIHAKAIVVDTHNDILMKSVETGLSLDQDLKGRASTDLLRWKKGGLDVQVFSIYCDGDINNPFAFAKREMDSLDAVVKRNHLTITKAAEYNTIVTAVRHHKIAALFGVEGGHMIEDDLEKLDALYLRGARYLTLTHNIAPRWCTSAADETSNPSLPHKGLTEFGKKVIQRMNQIGMIIDVSHAGEQTFWDVIQTTNKPIIASHSSVFALVPHRRNLKDEQIKAIAKNGGVIQVNFNPGFIDSSFDKKESSFFARHAKEFDSVQKAGIPEFYAQDYLYARYAEEANTMRPSLDLLIAHIEYIIKLVGIDYVGLGSDFDGINLTPQQLDDVSSYPLITKALVEKGYSKRDIFKILGGNFLRVLKANEAGSIQTKKLQ
jgi:membrane dipeptidase